jgi:hypothetical protein
LVAVVIDAANAVPASHHSAIRVERTTSTSQSTATSMAGKRICASPSRVTRCHALRPAPVSSAPLLARALLRKGMAEC